MSKTKEKPTLTLLIFMAADNNLDSSAMKDLESIRKSSFYSDMNIVVQLDRWEFVDAKESFRYHIKGGEEKIIKRLGEVNSGNPAVLKSFIEESAKAYPSDKVIVVIWSHGLGVDDKDVYIDVSNVERERFFVKEKKIEEIGVSYDDEAKDFIDNIELQKALDTDVKIDVLGFDACLMGMFEIAYQLKNQARVMVASQYLSPSAGWPYEKILEETKSEDTPEEIAKKIVNFYADSYDGLQVSVTQSAYDSKIIDDAAQHLDRFAKVLKMNLSDKKDLKRILSRTETFGRSDYIDLTHFAKLVKEEFTFDAIEPLLASLKKMILSNRAIGNGMQDVYGVSIYFPGRNPFKETFEMYEKLDFSHDCPHWIKLIRWYHS